MQCTSGKRPVKKGVQLSGLARLIVAGLIMPGIGFLGAGLDPGPGPRVVKGSLTIGQLYVPPLLVGLTAQVMASLVAARIRWMPAVTGVFASILLIGSVTFGWRAVSLRLFHPGEIIGFLEDSLQIVGEAIATMAGILAVARPTLHNRSRAIT
jgi:hypothetical protein